jgi:hypothetical protein
MRKLSLFIHYSVISQSYPSHILEEFEEFLRFFEGEKGVGRTCVWDWGRGWWGVLCL